MKTKIFFTSIALCAMMISLVSCEPTTFGKKNVLINLAELGEKVDGKSVEEIEKILSKNGFAKFYDWSYERAGYFNRMCVYSNGIQLDSTCFERDMTSELSLLEDNACVLVVDYFKEKDQTWVELAACYIFPNNLTKDYKTLSNNLYRYCSTNYSFKASTETPKELARGYMWSGDIYIDSKYNYYSSKDDEYNFALQSGWITQEEYNEEMAGIGYGFRVDFVEQLDQPLYEVYEEFEAVDFTQNKFMYAGLLLSEDSYSFFETDGVMMAECYWVGHEPELPIETPRRFTPRGRKIPEKFHWLK